MKNKKWTKEYKKEYLKKWRKENPEKIKNWIKKWKERNPDYYKKYLKKYNIDEYLKNWHKKHPNYRKRYKNSVKRWVEKNMDRKLFLNARRRARIRGAIGSFTFGEWELLKKQYGYCCPCCSKCEPEIKLTEDHIIPLSKGGSNYIENIQPLCGSCNSKKHDKVIKYEPEKQKKN